MSSKNRPPFLSTLKGRLFISSSICLGVLYTAIFIFIFHRISTNLDEGKDRQLKKFINFYKMYEVTESKGDEEYLPKKINWVFDKLGWIMMNDGDSKENPAIYSLHAHDGSIKMKSYENLSHLIPHESLNNKISEPFQTHFENIILSNGSHYRLMFFKLEKGYLLAALSREDDRQKLSYYQKVFIIAGLFMIVLTLMTSWVTLAKATSGIERTKLAADSITQRGIYTDIIPLKNEGAEVDALITSFNKMVEKTDTLLNELEQVSNNVAHDLRTPVTRLKTMAQTVLLNKSNISYEEFAAQVLEQCEQQSDIIETVLTITGLESEAAKLNLEEVNLTESLQNLCNLYEASAENKGVKLNFESTQEFTAKCDKKRIERAFANLIDNAVKYTDKGGAVEILVRQEEGRSLVEIKDSGCGIKKEEQNEVFKRFYRCDESRSKDGNGLGLSLANAVIKAHKGYISLTSEIGRGSSFTVNIPA